MKLLLDTHALVWSLTSADRLTRKARRAIEGGEVLASVASLWELVLKAGKKGALLEDPIPWWDEFVVGRAIPVVSIRGSHIQSLARLPAARHRDPFDRILVAQCQVERAAFVSKDQHLKDYPIAIIW